MKRSTLALTATLVVAVAAAAAVTPVARAAGTLCVGSRPGCFSTIQAAVNAAQDGDTIAVAPGTFAGGVTIDVSVNLIGAGSNKTIIQGGGPVVTIGHQDGPVRAVSVRGVTITGGLNNSVPDTVVSFGGGVSIPWATGFTTGATVTIADSVITGNRVTPQTTAPPGDFCGPMPCAFAFGGAIDNAGTLTVTNTLITDNRAGSTPMVSSVASGAGAGGIFNEGLGTLTLLHSVVSGNQAAVNAPNGSFVMAGGIDSAGALTVEDSVVSGNSVDLSSALPSDAGPEASVGGIYVGGSATITRTIVHGNSVNASNMAGDVLAFSGGIQDDGSLLLSDSTVDQNHVSASVPGSSGSTAIAAQGGLGVGGDATVRNSLIANNRVIADSATGAAIVGGGGVANFGQTTLEKTLVIGNTATATGASGSAQGGGINNFTLGGPPPSLTLTDSAVLANKLTASPGITPQGGGLFTAFPVTLTRTVIAGNKPDQCYGC